MRVMVWRPGPQAPAADREQNRAKEGELNTEEKVSSTRNHASESAFMSPPSFRVADTGGKLPNAAMCLLLESLQGIVVPAQRCPDLGDICAAEGEDLGFALEA